MKISMEEFYNSDDNERLKLAKDTEKWLHEKKIVLYGAGTIGRILKEVFDKLKLNVEFCVDKKYKEIVEIGGGSG